MKPGPGVSELRDARRRRCRGCTHARRGLGSRAFGRDQRASGTPGTRPQGRADARAGQGVCELSPRPLPAASHPLPNIRRPTVLGSGKEEKELRDQIPAPRSLRWIHESICLVSSALQRSSTLPTFCHVHRRTPELCWRVRNQGHLPCFPKGCRRSASPALVKLCVFHPILRWLGGQTLILKDNFRKRYR